ncbi:MAG: GNAT family N-acetyltransferase, partial [Flavobacteriales bacterium]|nr:GNAT family N-acetyltransferase [Flavobacteriales bacterium]
MNQGETSIVIRAGKKEDVPAIMSLIHDLALFEKSPESVLISEAELLRDGFEENPLYAVLVAEIDMQVVGM